MVVTGIIALYYFLFFFIIIFSIGQLAILISYLINKKNETKPLKINSFPSITIQLPVYNERFVIGRLLDAVSALNYPNDRIEIQVLDDSTDDTLSIAEKKIRELQESGLDIKHICRADRTGFKAGALQNGLMNAKGEFIAIFDADFIPDRNFLINTIPYFYEDNIGLVQTRWGFLNAENSWLTKAQQLALDGHFIIEQEGRSKSGYFINFNGTAGIWRKSCILDAGGWEADTLTEDLDLSYRAQLKGWKLSYCPDIITPSELPDRLSAVKSQQFRWTKGGVETSKKLISKLWQSNNTLAVKLFGSFHLLNHYIYLFVLLTALLSVPVMIVKSQNSDFQSLEGWNTLFISIFIVNFIYYLTATLKNGKTIVHSVLQFLEKFPVAIIVSLGLTYHNSKAIISGLKGEKTEFVRTPKLDKHKEENEYIKETNSGRVRIPELVLFFYFLIAVFSGIYLGEYGFLLYHILLLSGYGLVLYKSINNS